MIASCRGYGRQSCESNSVRNRLLEAMKLGRAIELAMIVQQRAECDSQSFALSHRDRAASALLHRFAAERVGDKDAEVAVVPPAFAEVLVARHQHDAAGTRAAAGVVTPSSWQAPCVLRGPLARRPRQYFRDSRSIDTSI